MAVVESIVDNYAPRFCHICAAKAIFDSHLENIKLNSKVIEAGESFDFNLTPVPVVKWNKTLSVIKPKTWSVEKCPHQSQS